MSNKPQLEWSLSQLAQVVPTSLEAVLSDIINRLDKVEFALGLRSSPPSGDFLPGDDLTSGEGK
jgi:hypothetical protein